MPPREGPAAVLRINGDLGRAAAVARALNAIEGSYNGLYTFEVITTRRYGLPYFFDELGPSPSPRFWPPGPLRPSTTFVSHEDLLILRQAQFSSPGFWTVAGAVATLKLLLTFINNERRRLENRRRIRLNEVLTEVAIARIGLDAVAEGTRQLRDLGVPESVVREIAIRLVLRPLRRLEDAQDEGQISSAELVEPREDRDEPERSG